MPTESSLRNLRVSPEVRAENTRKMVVTKRLAKEGRYREMYEKYVRLAEALNEPLLSFEKAAPIMKMNRDTLARAVRWVRSQQK